MAVLPIVKALILDLDGVLWRANTPIGDLPHVFRQIEHLGLKTILATNNATLSIGQYMDKIAGFGVHIRPDQIINSGQALAYALHKQHPAGGKVYIIGGEGLTAALAERGFEHSEEAEVVAVVVGMDRMFTYDKMVKATLLIRAGAPFWGTNPDRTYPMPYGLIPGAGAILASIEAATDQNAIIAGKPSPAMFELALERLETRPSETLMVGDRLETDIDGAHRVGIRTALVLSGVTGQAEASAWLPTPDLILPDLTALVDHWHEYFMTSIA